MNYLVFDIGGTNTRFAFFKDYKLIEKDSFRTIKDNSLLSFLISKTSEIINKHNLSYFDGICISAPGFLEREKLKMTAPTNLPKIKNLDLSSLKKFCKKLVLEHDGDCAALGAFKLENNKPNNLACITLGTGVGCGLILNGKIYTGNKVGSEFGHSTIDIHGKKDNSGNFGTIENYISISGLHNLIKKRGLKGGSFELREMALKGNKKALLVYEDYSSYLATALVNLVNTLDLDSVYITGGLVNSQEFFFEKAIKKARKRFFRGINPKIKATSENLCILGGLELLKKGS
jgi:glucokinase